MQCNEARQQLETMQAGAMPEPGGELAAHLQACDECRDLAREHQLSGLLASLPVPEPTAGFEDRILGNTLGQRGSSTPRVHARWALATAASVVLAVLVTLQFSPTGSGPAPAQRIQASVVEVQPLRTRDVSVLLNSPRALNDALITVQLDSNLALEGYRDVHNLQWRTSLKSGANRLALPVQLLEGDSGMITVTVEHQGSSKRFSVQVKAAPGATDSKVSLV